MSGLRARANVGLVQCIYLLPIDMLTILIKYIIWSLNFKDFLGESSIYTMYFSSVNGFAQN